MKAVFYLFVLLMIWVSTPALAQDVFTPYYVVIGGFSVEENAQKLCDYANEQNLPAVYAYNEERKIFYVYVRATQTREIANDIRSRLRSSTVFKDAWVFNGVLSGSKLLAKKEPAPVMTTPDPEPVIAEIIPDPVAKTPEEAPSSAVPGQGEPKGETPKPVGRPFVFKLLNQETGDIVEGLVRLQESDRARQFRGVNGNEKVYVPAPANRSGKWVVVCHALGFREYRESLNYEKAAEFDGASIGNGDEVIIPLALERVRRGDYIEMEGVKFFNNAALFTPGSERQLGELVALMEENPGYQIRLHGHTNGNDARDIVSIGSSTDLFNPDVANAKSHASSKELSLLRAELVKTYLVSQGIDASRITTRGEGGKQMIFDPRGTLAGMNDRVEVEIKKH